VKRDMDSVSSSSAAVVWLWMAHNAVNERLAGDETEDPEYPKIQFPSAENCPKCRDSHDKWVLEEVLAYVKRMYAEGNIRYVGADSSVVLPGLDGAGSTLNNTGSAIEGVDSKTV